MAKLSVNETTISLWLRSDIYHSPHLSRLLTAAVLFLSLVASMPNRLKNVRIIDTLPRTLKSSGSVSLDPMIEWKPALHIAALHYPFASPISRDLKFILISHLLHDLLHDLCLLISHKNAPNHRDTRHLCDVHINLAPKLNTKLVRTIHEQQKDECHYDFHSPSLSVLHCNNSVKIALL